MRLDRAPPVSWSALTGESGGSGDVAFDLSAYAGGSVDVKVSYVTDAVGVEAASACSSTTPG